jgi:hypothetical protein
MFEQKLRDAVQMSKQNAGMAGIFFDRRFFEKNVFFPF